MYHRFAFFVALLATSAVAHGANILSITGPSPFGFANQIALTSAWRLTSAYSNVSITMPLADDPGGSPTGGVEGTVYLMNQIGPGTTVANQVAPPVSISGLTASFTTRTLFSGLTLPAGNYYVVLVSTNPNPLSISPEGSSTPTVTPGSGVADLGSGSASSLAMFGPASNITLSLPDNSFITVTGDLVPTQVPTQVPTLNTVGLGVLMLGLAGAALLLLRRRRA
jgi:hypothetical protein